MLVVRALKDDVALRSTRFRESLHLGNEQDAGGHYFESSFFEKHHK